MVCRGKAHGLQIDLDEPLDLPDGTDIEVRVTRISTPRRGSPEAIMSLIGTLSQSEADAIQEGADACRTIDSSLWRRGTGT
jgi:hypothetical protein